MTGVSWRWVVDRLSVHDVALGVRIRVVVARLVLMAVIVVLTAGGTRSLGWVVACVVAVTAALVDALRFAFLATMRSDPPSTVCDR